MLDDGAHGDGAPGDGLFGAIIPASTAKSGQLIRWYVTATAAGIKSRWPLASDLPRHPHYLGTMIEKANPAAPLPVYDLFVEGYWIPGTSSAGSGIDSDAGGLGAVYAFGHLYDNVFIRIKGTTSRHLFKRSHRVDFNPGHYFLWDASQAPLRELNLNAEFPDPSYARQYLSCWLQREAGTGAAPHFPVRLQMNGEFWQLAFHTMSVGDELLRYMGLDAKGALYKQVEQLLPVSRMMSKKTRRSEPSSDYTTLAAALNEKNPLEKRRIALYDRTDLPAVINYIAVTRLTQEGDDVWANMVLYRDSLGSEEWRPIPFDLNLSFGQLFYDGDEWNTHINGTNDLNKSHPLYGSSATRTRYPSNRYHPSGTYFNQWYNRLHDAVIRVPETRAMLLRRTRTLMDQFLKPPGTPTSELPIEAELGSLATRILPDAELDRKKWGWPPVDPNFGVHGLGPNYSPAKGIADLKELYLTPRRYHLYVTHSATNTAKQIGIRSADNAGIPLPQPPHPSIQFGVVEDAPALVARQEDFIQLVNTNTLAVDLSGWRLEGTVRHRFKPGTVLAPDQALYVCPNVRSFRSRTSSPKGGEGCFARGGSQRVATDSSGTLVLRDDTGELICSRAPR
jgi:hypothetical protein